MFETKISELIHKKELVAVQRNHLSNSTLYGKVLYVNSDIIIIKNITTGGEFIGFSLLNVNDITEVYWGNRFYDSINRMTEFDHEDSDDFPWDINIDDFRSTFLSIADKYTYIEVFQERSSENFECSKLLEYDDEWLYFESLGTKATLSSSFDLVRWDSITRIDFNSSYTNKLANIHHLD